MGRSSREISLPFINHSTWYVEGREGGREEGKGEKERGENGEMGGEIGGRMEGGKKGTNTRMSGKSLIFAKVNHENHVKPHGNMHHNYGVGFYCIQSEMQSTLSSCTFHTVPYASIQQAPLNSIIAAANSISSVASTTLARNVSLFTL